MSQQTEFIPYEEKKFHDDKFASQDFILSPAQFKAEVGGFAKPIEDAWFEKGRLAGLAEAGQKVRDQVIVRAADMISKPAKSPVDLAARAAELREEATKRGEELTHLESVRAAYKEAGVPI